MAKFPKYARLTPGDYDNPTQDVEDLIVIENNLDDGGEGAEVTSADITDATTVGRAVLTAEDEAAARDAIDAGTSSLELGSSGTTAAAGNHAHAGLTADQVAATASIRTLGTGAQQAATGNHTHTVPTATQVTAGAISPGTATTVQGILAELAARISALEADAT